MTAALLDTGALLPVQPAELPARFFRALDRSSYDEMLALLAPDCTWLRQGRLLEGREAIRRAMHARPANLVVRHLLSAVLVDPLGDDMLSIQVTMAAYAGNGDPPLELALPRQVADYQFTACQQGGAWRIAEIAARSIFRT